MNPQKIANVAQTFAKLAKFRQIWPHWLATLWHLFGFLSLKLTKNGAKNNERSRDGWGWLLHKLSDYLWRTKNKTQIDASFEGGGGSSDQKMSCVESLRVTARYKKTNKSAMKNFGIRRWVPPFDYTVHEDKSLLHLFYRWFTTSYRLPNKLYSYFNWL